jgi:NADH-quinone oxidoreductase subunit C
VSVATDPTAIIDVLRAAVPDATIEPAPAIDMPAIAVDRDHIVDLLTALRDHPALQFSFLVDVTAVDYLPAVPRFEVVYLLACLGPAFRTAGAATAAPLRRLRMKVRLAGDDPRIQTATGVFPGANWPEREVFDLFGITFEQHPNLTRILTPDDWTGYPLRKDYPVQIRKDTATWSPIQLTAEEFAANVREGQARAARQAAGGAPKPATRD